MNKYTNLFLNTLLFCLNSIGTKIIPFLLVPLYTSYLSSSEYGLTDLSQTVIYLIYPIITLNISEAVVRSIVESNNGCVYAAIGFAISLMSILLLLILLPLLGFSIFGGLGQYKIGFMFAYSSYCLMNLCGEITRGKGDIKNIPIAAAISSIFTLCLSILCFVFLNLKVEGYFISISIGPIAALIFYMWKGELFGYIRDGFVSLYKSNEKKEILKWMLKYSIPLIPNSLFWWFNTSVSRMYITGIIGISANGLFAAASKIPGLLNTVYSIFQQAWQLSAFQEIKQNNINSFFSNVYNLIRILSSILCSLMILFSSFLAAVFLKGESYNSWPLICFLLLANLFNIYSTFLGTIYTSTMHTKFIMKTTCMGALICMILSPLLISNIGIVGACLASLIAQFFVFLFRVFDSKKYILINFNFKIFFAVIFTLLIQSFCMYLQVPYYMLLSSICFITIFLIQCPELYRYYIFASRMIKNHSTSKK